MRTGVLFSTETYGERVSKNGDGSELSDCINVPPDASDEEYSSGI